MMKPPIERQRFGLRALVIAGSLAAFAAITPAKADLIESISQGNAALSGFTGPFATLDIHLNSATSATVTFTSLANGTTLYRMGDGSTVGLNVTGTFTASTPVEGGTATGFTPTFSAFDSGNVDGWGTFNLIVDNVDGYGDSATSVTFNLTATGGTTWTEATILTNNNQGANAEVHVFPCAEQAGGNCSASINTFANQTGFAANGGTNVPEPASLAIFGAALTGLGLIRRRRKGAKQT